MIGIALSVIFPGLGQFYYGKWVRGTMMVLGGVTPVYLLAVEEAKGSGQAKYSWPLVMLREKGGKIAVTQRRQGREG